MDHERLIIDFINENYKEYPSVDILVLTIEMTFGIPKGQILTIIRNQAWRLSNEAAEFVK